MDFGFVFTLGFVLPFKFKTIIHNMFIQQWKLKPITHIVITLQKSPLLMRIPTRIYNSGVKILSDYVRIANPNQPRGVRGFLQ